MRAEGLPVVGFDIAGEEAGYPPADHCAAYQYAHDHFIHKTAHAGEAYGPESIRQAITQCHANRIGHGTFLFAHEMIKDPGIQDCLQQGPFDPSPLWDFTATTDPSVICFAGSPSVYPRFPFGAEADFSSRTPDLRRV